MGEKPKSKTNHVVEHLKLIAAAAPDQVKVKSTDERIDFTWQLYPSFRLDVQSWVSLSITNTNPAFIFALDVARDVTIAKREASLESDSFGKLRE